MQTNVHRAIDDLRTDNANETVQITLKLRISDLNNADTLARITGASRTKVMQEILKAALLDAIQTTVE